MLFFYCAICCTLDCTLDSATESKSEEQTLGSLSTFSKNRAEPADSSVVIRNGSLRQRGGGPAQVEIEESLLQPGPNTPLRGGSMSLFATLVPPPLRKSKKSFTNGELDTSLGVLHPGSLLILPIVPTIQLSTPVFSFSLTRRRVARRSPKRQTGNSLNQKC